jgi:tetratricopeptide (TPR) repeat protein
MYQPRMIHRRLLLPLLAAGITGAGVRSAAAQVTSVRSGSEKFDRDSARSSEVRTDPGALANAARASQLQFEQFRRTNLPESHSSRGGGSCDEQVGRFCYWYDEKEPPPPREPDRIREARARLISLLDSAAAMNPANLWVASQRVRYLSEAGRDRDAIAAAGACRGETWRCGVLVGFALHEAGDYVRADSAYQAALRDMPARDRCEWEDISLLLDEELLPRYRAQQCGDSARVAFERRVWWLARPLFSTPANDARTEHYARVTMSHMLTEAPSAHEGGFDQDERELLLRYSWPRAWSRAGGGFGGGRPSVVGHEPTPAYPYLPNALVYDNPVNTDSLRWTTRPGVVHARYAPAYATPLLRLEHQSALFRRGDSSLVVLAYDLRSDSALAQASDVRAALVLTRGDERDATVVRAPNKSRGVITAHSVWAPLLMSAEVTSPTVRRSARARYGIRPPYAVGARVSLSDLLLFEPYGQLPASLDEVIPHAMPTLRVRADKKVGFYWEAYGTNPAGEVMNISVVVAPEVTDEPTRARRLKRALGMWKEAKPVSVQVQDVSARGQTTSARSVEVDLSTLTPGAYLVELEVEVAKQYRVRAERRIVVVE